VNEADLERLRAAWLNAGPRPDVHDAAKRQLRENWPTLYEALVALFSETGGE
jgi:hypothetical protein